MRGTWCRAVWLSALVGAGLVGTAESGPEAQQRVEALLAEVSQAQQAQDHSRLRAAYAEIAALRPDAPEYQRGLGLACYLGGDYDGAIAALQRAASLQPGLAGVSLYLGISYYRTNRFQEALEALERAPERDSGAPAAQFWLGATYRALGRHSEAVPLLEAAHEKAQSDAEILLLLTRTYSEHAAGWFRQLLAVAGTSAPARLLRAEELAMDGVDQAAMKETDAALERDPGLIGLHLLRGQILWAGENFDKGADEFRRELENDPLSAEAHLMLGAYQLDVGDASAALAHLRLARRYRPNDEVTRELLEEAMKAGGVDPAPKVPARSPEAAQPTFEDAIGAYKRGRATEAAELLERLLARRPETAAARLILARCRIAEGELRIALEQLDRVQQKDREDPETLYLLGKTYEGLASQAAERLFELNPDAPGVRLLRGEAFERGPKYDFESALAEFRAAKQSSPDDPAVDQAIGRVLFKMKRFDEAVPHLEATLAWSPGHGTANYLLGKIRFLRGNRKDAIGPLREAVRARPSLVEPRRDLATALALEGRLEEAIGIYEDLLTDHPTDASLHALLATAYRRAGRIEDAKAHAERARTAGHK
ncbi:MAG: tetratricopeptide repeat protein [Bryobacterales bacterium]|nr:tetratricopeptide repeat protein [Bryobacterales bacterium]